MWRRQDELASIKLINETLIFQSSLILGNLTQFKYSIASKSPDEINNTLLSIVERKSVNNALNSKDFVEHLLDRGADVNAVVRGSTIFTVACQRSSVELIKLMLDRGADASFLNSDGHTPVYWAFASGQRVKIELFLERGIAAAEIDRSNLLSCYIDKGMAEKDIVQRLLQLGADVNCIDHSGRTPLNSAFLLHNNPRSNVFSGVELVKFLLQRGADPNLGSVCALAKLAESGDRELVELLLEHGADVNGHAADNWTPLALAAKRGRGEIVELLLRNGADIDFDPADNGTPLALAASRGHEGTVRLLLEHGAGRDDRALYRMIGSCMDSASFVRFALERGFDPNFVEGNGDPLVLEALDRKNKTVVKLLLDHGARVNDPLPSGQCLLYLAVCRNYLEIVQLLIDYGADVNAEWRGETALSESVRVGFYLEDVSRVLVRQVALLKAQKLFVSEVNLSASKSEDYVGFYEECMSEMESLITSKFEDSDLSYFDVSKIRGIRRLTSLASNPKIYNVLKSGDFKMKFINYGDMIVDNFDRGVARNRDFELLKRFVNYLSSRDRDRLPKLPFTFVDELFNYLDDSDISLLRKL